VSAAEVDELMRFYHEGAKAGGFEGGGEFEAGHYNNRQIIWGRRV
jgi:hypothetical protein